MFAPQRTGSRQTYSPRLTVLYDACGHNFCYGLYCLNVQRTTVLDRLRSEQVSSKRIANDKALHAKRGSLTTASVSLRFLTFCVSHKKLCTLVLPGTMAVTPIDLEKPQSMLRGCERNCTLRDLFHRQIYFEASTRYMFKLGHNIHRRLTLLAFPRLTPMPMICRTTQPKWMAWAGPRITT